MILLMEPDKTVRKKLCDLLRKERIMGTDSVSQTLEMLCKYKMHITVIIADIHLLREIISHRLIFRLCKKLCIETPPLLGFYKNGDEKITSEFQKDHKQYRLIKYNEKDSSFPDQYLQMIKEVYPDLNAELAKAREVWSREKVVEEYVDPREWFKEEGFLEVIQKEKVGKPEKEVEVKQKKIEERKEVKDYKEMYFELKKKYDELLKYVNELVDSV